MVSTPAIPSPAHPSFEVGRFDRGSTIYIAHDLLPGDAAAVTHWLAARLPGSVAEPVL